MRINNPLFYFRSMKSREQKIQEVQEGEKLLKKSQSLIFVNLEKVSAEDLRSFKMKLKKLGAQFKVIKKRLLRIIFKENKIDFDLQSKFERQLGTIFASTDIYSIANPLYKFLKDIKILGAYNLTDKQFLEADLFKTIALLPSREILLTQLVGVLSAPIKMFLYILQERSKKVEEHTN